MKKRIILFIISTFLLTACNDTVNSQPSNSTINETTSWAYEFVKYNGAAYQLTEFEVDDRVVGQKIGEVKRNIAEMDVVYHTETDLDSNKLVPGTNLYENIEDPNAIIYQLGNKYFSAVKVN